MIRRIFIPAADIENTDWNCRLMNRGCSRLEFVEPRAVWLVTAHFFETPALESRLQGSGSGVLDLENHQQMALAAGNI